MKKVMMLLIMFIFMQPIIQADLTSITTGPYKVSFDLGFPNDTYIVKVDEPKISEALSGSLVTNYHIDINNRVGLTKFATISLKYENILKPIPNPDEMEASFRLTMLKNYQDVGNVDSAVRAIDNTTGAVGSFNYKGISKLFMAQYYPKCEEGRLLCVIGSSYPWEEGTLQLLKTIHIEKINAMQSSGLP